ncbi:hypothetical protein J3U66_05675 [Gilliamella sp. B2969]|nr:hypothetical protein [Gilliamella sp. B2969]
MNGFTASIILLIVSLACITLLTGLSWLLLMEKLGALVMLLLTPITWLFSSHKTSASTHTVTKQRDKDIALTTQTKEQPVVIPLESNKVNLDTEQPLSITANEEKVINHVDATNQLEQNNPITLNKDDEALIQTAEQLLQSLEQTTNNQPDLSSTPVNDEPKKDLDPNDILARMEVIIKNMNERKLALSQDQTNATLPQSNLANDPQATANQTTTDSEKVQPFDENKYTISDAPSKPLFTLNNNESTLANNTIDSNQFISNEPESSTQDVEQVTHQEPETLIEHPTPEIERHIPEDVDLESLKNENPVIDDIYLDDTEVEQSHNTPITIDDENDSLIHPLLRRDDKPLPKPTTPLPSLDLLTAPPTTRIEVDHAALNAMSELIEKSLADYRVKAKVVDYMPGPVITRFEIELAPGIKAARISTLDRDLARSLSMPSVRVVEVIPGKPYVGIELPNKNRQTVYFREVLDSPQFRNAQSPLTIVLGKDISGQSVVADLAKMPHLLVAGTTGSGKSVGVNAMILSILYKSQPEDVRFIMIDPKMLELSIYEGIPHLLTQVVTDMKDAANALNWCVNEMERRYRLMSALGVRNIAGYNEKIKQAQEMGRPIPDPLWKPTDSMDLNMPTLEKLPYIVVMVDEFADLIMAVGKKVEELIARLAQKARAAGIHLVLATQRPSVDVITGLIKANIPTRIAFTVSSKIDSRTILDQMGAESLLGMGDMLYLAPNSSIPIRVHGAFVRDEEVHAVVQDWKARGKPKYIENVTVSTDDNDSCHADNIDEDLDPLFDQVVEFVVETRRASISSVQRKFRIGYNRAARIVEQMEIEGIISAPSHNGTREVIVPHSHGDF